MTLYVLLEEKRKGKRWTPRSILRADYNSLFSELPELSFSEMFSNAPLGGVKKYGEKNAIMLKIILTGTAGLTALCFLLYAGINSGIFLVLGIIGFLALVGLPILKLFL